MTDNTGAPQPIDNQDAITHAGEIPADLRPHVEAPEDTAALAARPAFKPGGLAGLLVEAKRTHTDPFPHMPMRYATVDEDGRTLIQKPVAAFDMLRQVFESQAYFQGLLGHEYNDMSTEELIEYLKGQVMALQAETIEALDEMSWKPWTHGEKFVNRDTMLGECADILCFLVNIVLGLGFTSQDFYAAHQEKALRNIKRQEDKYDGVSDKCPTCRRDLNDLKAKNISTGNFGGVDFCDRPECVTAYRTQKGI
jgi:hypothetical protein